MLSGTVVLSGAHSRSHGSVHQEWLRFLFYAPLDDVYFEMLPVLPGYHHIAGWLCSICALSQKTIITFKPPQGRPRSFLPDFLCID
jgi:hypothetical protein